MILFFLNIIIFSGLFCLLFFPKHKHEKIRDFHFLLTSFLFLTSLVFFLLHKDFPSATEGYQNNFILHPSLDISLSLFVDSLTILFLLLTTFIFFLISLTARTLDFRVKELYGIIFLLEGLITNAFSCSDLLTFYILFEAILFPMFLMIGIWGSHKNKIFASNQLVLYTVFGSFSLLLSLILLINLTGTCNIFVIKSFLLPSHLENLIFFLLFISFAVKVPMFPLHLWLPKAHVEAPTIGSVLLAGLLLKLGSYGFLRYSIFLFPYASEKFTWLILSLCSIGVVYSSITTLRQIDLKRFIAYSSIAHMNYIVGGLFSKSIAGIAGSLLLQTAHGFSSSALFLCIGFLYERYGTRNIFYYGGLASLMPIFTIFFFFFSLANLGLPGTVNFIGEILIMNGIFERFSFTSLIMLLGLFFSALYSFVLLSRLLFGPFSSFISFYGDLSRREFLILLPLFLSVIVFGLVPNTLLSYWTFFLESWTY